MRIRTAVDCIRCGNSMDVMDVDQLAAFSRLVGFVVVEGTCCGGRGCATHMVFGADDQGHVLTMLDGQLAEVACSDARGRWVVDEASLLRRVEDVN